jgi:putative transcriptional regulator
MKENDFQNLLNSIKQAGKIKKGQLKPDRSFKFSPVDIKSIRNKLHQSQSEFAFMIGVSISTLQNWEQGRRKPDGPAKALLKVAAENPEAVRKALDA